MTSSPSPMTLPSKAPLLSSVYKEIKEQGFSAFLLPKTDAHRSEYCPERDNLVHFLTNFSGSTGCAALKMTPDPKAAVFVDGRYTIQIEQEVDSTLFDYEDYTFDAIESWITKGLKPGDIIGYDPLLLSIGEYDQYKKRFQKHGLKFEPLCLNPIEAQWQDRPPLDKPAVVPHPLEYAGIPFKQKISLIQEMMALKKAEGFFLNYAESIAWLFNIRAPERLITPAASLYAYIPRTGPCSLFVHDVQNTQILQTYCEEAIVLERYEDVFEILADKVAGHSVAIDPNNCTMKMLEAIEQKGGKTIKVDDFCNLPRACKNETELKGARQAHIRDGAAVSNLLAWIDQTIATKKMTEQDVVDKIYDYRQQQDLFQGKSFDTIAGSGPNGAIVHYCVDEASNRTFRHDDIFLLDSGGQYLDGTTDITRTLCLNKSPTEEQKDRYTRVLKGHIALARIHFPEGTVGSQLDPFARSALWEIGCDYAHGTGHGVGSYLGVHEGPQRISPRPNTVPLRPGMILSNEPGYYKQGEYGIRLESLVIVTRVPQSSACDGKAMLCFDTLTLAPFDLSLIEKRLLTNEDIMWLNTYHQRVYETLQEHVETSTKDWLKNATAPLSL